MSWKKHLRAVSSLTPSVPNHSLESRGASEGTSGNFASYLPEVYAGHPNRIQRYYQYEDMDRDSDISAALDTIADFCTQSEEQNDEPFEIHYNETPTEAEVRIIKEALSKWVKLNKFRADLWTMFRNTIKAGDQFFLRDPETFRWNWVDHFTVEGVKVDETQGKEPDGYLIRALSYNDKAKYATSVADPSQFRSPYGNANVIGARASASSMPGGIQTSGPFTLAGAGRDPRQQKMMAAMNNEVHMVDAGHVVHLSLSNTMNPNWPFGTSVLEAVYKTYKQKEMLEDAIIIYRVQRAPERRIFYIDVGAMPPARAKAHIEAIKNEIHQRRIPNKTGGGSSILDAAYNPLSVMEDYFFAQSAEGRGSKVETLPGGDQTGEITDLSFFSKKLMRGLRIPPSYMPFGDDQGATYSDGKLGSALIQEFRFNKYCMRIQNQLAPTFDYEFKYFLQESGIEVSVDHTMFEIRFNPPQNFGKYRQIEVDVAQVGVYQQVADNPHLSVRFKMKRFLGLSDDEIIENETMWKEENPDRLKRRTGATTAEVEPSGDLSSVGFRPPPSEDFSLPDLGDEPPPDDGSGGDPLGDLGAAPAGGPTGGPPVAGGGGAAAPVPGGPA